MVESPPEAESVVEKHCWWGSHSSDVKVSGPPKAVAWLVAAMVAGTTYSASTRTLRAAVGPTAR